MQNAKLQELNTEVRRSKKKSEETRHESCMRNSFNTKAPQNYEVSNVKEWEDIMKGKLNLQNK